MNLATTFELTIKRQSCLHIEASQLICTENQLTGFYMRATLAFTGLMQIGGSSLYIVLPQETLHSAISPNL